MLAFSATYTDVLLKQLHDLMRFPQEVMLCPQTVSLKGALLRVAALRHHRADLGIRRRDAALRSSARRRALTPHVTLARL